MRRQPAPELRAADAPLHVRLGRITGVYGVKGWVRIYSYTQPRENILRYSPWLIRQEGAGAGAERGGSGSEQSGSGQAGSLSAGQGREGEQAQERGWYPVEVLAGRRHGAGIVARLAGCDDRDAARRLMGAEIAVERARLPACETDEYYWVDLIGLRVENLQGVALGRVTGLLETGAHDVLVVRNGRERLIPYVRGRVVQAIEPDAGLIRVDWDESWDEVS